MTISITGFEPFGSQSTNASWEVASRSPNEINGVRVIARQLPVVYYESIKVIIKVLREDPTVTDISSLGEAGGRSRISVEMIGVNMDDTNQPDNHQNVRKNKKIYADGDDAYFATLPVKQVVAYLKEHNIPAYCSWSAGQFLCNHSLYGVLHYIKKRYLNTRVGFCHLPYTFQQAAAANLPGLATSDMVRAIEHFTKYLVDNPGQEQIIDQCYMNRSGHN